MIPPCITHSDFGSELIGSFTEAKIGNNMNHGIIQTIERVMRERLRIVCKETNTEYINDQLILIEKISREIEKDILSYFAKQIESDEMTGFFRFGINGGELTQSIIFEELYRLYTLRHGTNEADIMEEKMSNPANEGKVYIMIEYGRNMKNKELFIQRIFLKETK